MKPIAESTDAPDRLVFKETLTLLDAIGEHIASQKPTQFGSQTEFNLADLNRALIDTVSQVFDTYANGNDATADERWVGLRDKCEILKRRIQYKDLQAFFDLSPEAFEHLTGIKGGTTVKELVSIKQIFERQMPQTEIDRWLHAPNGTLDGKTPVEAIADGQAYRILQILIHIEQGIPY
jgi:hypothetical protein